MNGFYKKEGGNNASHVMYGVGCIPTTAWSTSSTEEK